MAQRSYLIPFSNEIKEIFLELIETDNGDLLWNKINELSKPHQKVLFYSKRFAANLDDEQVENGWDLEYGLVTNMRPYVIIEDESSKAVEIVDCLLKCQEDKQIFEICNQQLNNKKEYLKEDRIPIETFNEDRTIFDGVKKQVEILKDYKEAFVKKQSATIVIPKQIETELGIEISPFETEIREIKYKEIPRYYGQLIGQTFGELCGLCYPTWWLGRNYWFGLLMHGELGTIGQIPYLALRKYIKSNSVHPIQLFERMKINGFEAGFNIKAPSYQLGYYFPDIFVGEVLNELKNEYKKFHKLGKLVTNFSDKEIKFCEKMVIEGFEWAYKNKLNLIEGDDLVGDFGER